ncbi:MAG: chloride channel protein [Geminicoccaceae bacterium]
MAFNTPLAGIVFGIEEMSRSYEARASGLIIGAIIAAGLTSPAPLGSLAPISAPRPRSWAG